MNATGIKENHRHGTDAGPCNKGYAYVLAAIIFMTVGVSFPSLAADTEPDDSDRKAILAVFAHPDDETLVGPALARYVREGAEVIVVIATDGRLGVTDFAGYEAGDELAAVRREEMQCAADVLGVELIHWEYEDQLNMVGGLSGFIAKSRGILEDLHQVIGDVQPDVIVTFGPDGYSNHIDHRIIGLSTTQVVLSKQWENEPALFFVGTPSSELDDDWIYGGVDDAFLTVQVPYTDEDADTALESSLCHASQLRPEVLKEWSDMMRERGSIIHFRPFEAPRGQSDDLFEYPSQYP